MGTRHRIALLAAVLAAPVMPAGAEGPYDGVWYPQPARTLDGKTVERAHCAPAEANGAYEIRDNAFEAVEIHCEMTNPAPVDGMNATFFDVACSGEDGDKITKTFVLLSEDGTSLTIADKWGSEVYARCQP